MASTLVDLAKINITSTGTGPLTLGSAASGYRGREALVDGKTYSYSIQQGAAYEVGRGVYQAATQQLTRSVLFSSSGGIPINLAVNAKVSFSALAEDLAEAISSGGSLANIPTPETNAYDLLYGGMARSPLRGTPKKFARSWAEAITMARDLTAMRGWAKDAGTTGGVGLNIATYSSGLGNLTNGQTTFAISWAYDRYSSIQVYKNGVLLAESAYSKTGGTGTTGTVVLNAAVVGTDTIMIQGYLPTWRVWNQTDDVNVEGSLRWAVAKAKAAGGGLALCDTNSRLTLEMKSMLLLDFSNFSIDAPGRNVRMGALNTVQMIRVAAPNITIQRLSEYRPAHYTIVDNQEIRYSTALNNATSGQTTFSIPFPITNSDSLRVNIDVYIDLSEGTDYTVDYTAKTITLSSAIGAHELWLRSGLYNQGCMWVQAGFADQVYINECTFSHHQTYAVNVQYGYVDVSVAASALRVGQRYKIKTLGTTNWNTVAGTSGKTYVVGDILTCAVAGTGTGVADSAPCRVSIERNLFNRMSAGMSIGSGILAQNTPPSWATDDAALLAAQRVTLVSTFDNVFDGVGRRSPNVNALAAVHHVNNVHIIDAHRADDGTITTPYAVNVLNGGHVLVEGGYMRLGSPYIGSTGMYATTTNWNLTDRQGQGALKVLTTVADDSLPINQLNTGSVAAVPYSYSVEAVPTTDAEKRAYLIEKYSAAGAEVNPLAEMTYSFVSKAEGDAAGLYTDGFNVIDTANGYLVRTAQVIPGSGNNTPDSLSVSTLVTSKLNMPRGSTLTIAAGVITIGASGVVTIDTEGSAATDDLDTVNGGSDGDIIALRIGVNTRKVRVTNAGNIAVPSPLWLNTNGEKLLLQYDGNLSKWVVLSGPSLVEGDYTPALTGVANVASSSAQVASYQRLPGSAYVNVSGVMTVTPTAANTSTTISIALPITSAVGANDVYGTATAVYGAGSASGHISAETSTGRALLTFYPPTSGAYVFRFSFRYKVL